MLMVFGSVAMEAVMPVRQLPAPGCRAAAATIRLNAGGAGSNQAHAAQRFGVPTVLIGAVGDDAFAGTVLDRLRLSGVDVRGVRHMAGCPTGMSVVHEAEDGQRTTVDAAGANAKVRAHWVDDDELARCRSVLVQLALPQESFSLARRARAQGCRTMLALSPGAECCPPPGLFDWVIADSTALRAATAIDGLEQAARCLAQRVAARVMLMLPSGAGLIVGAEGVRHRRAALSLQVVDGGGAHDTAAGVFAAGLNQGFSEPRALEHAVVAAALVRAQVGVQPAQPARHAIEDALLAAMADRP